MAIDNSVRFCFTKRRKYCGKCGRNHGHGCQMRLFDVAQCNGCSGQTQAKNYCDEQAKLSALMVPDNKCWFWAMCFRLACDQLALNLPLVAPMCGNRICELDEEESCPFDCCGNVNLICAHNATKCPPECCGDPTCCVTTGNTSNSNAHHHTVLAMLTILATVNVFQLQL